MLSDSRWNWWHRMASLHEISLFRLIPCFAMCSLPSNCLSNSTLHSDIKNMLFRGWNYVEEHRRVCVHIHFWAPHCLLAVPFAFYDGVTAGSETWELSFWSTDLSADSPGRLEKDTWIKFCFSWEKGHLVFRWRGLKSPLGHENPHKPHFTASNAVILRSQKGKEFYFLLPAQKRKEEIALEGLPSQRSVQNVTSSKFAWGSAQFDNHNYVAV